MANAKNIYLNYLIDVLGYSLSDVEELTESELKEEVETDCEFPSYARAYGFDVNAI